MSLDHDAVGGGPLVVLLHGGFAHRRVFGYQLLGLSERCCVVAVDLPGFGRSPWNPAEPWVHQAVEGVVALLGDIDAPSPVIVGWSIGAIVAHDVAARIPGARLVAVSASGVARPAETTSFITSRLLRDFPRYARSVVRTFTSVPVSPETEAWLFQMALDTGVEVHMAALSGADRGLSPMPAGAVVVHGLHDQIVPLASRPQAADERLFESSGHMPFLEEKERFNELIVEIADGRQAAPPGPRSPAR